MAKPHIAFIGKARSGKDSAAANLVRRHNYTRVAFADPLKEMALSINPLIGTGYGTIVRLSNLIKDVGWEYAKDRFPEVRRILQHCGEGVRNIDPDFWVNAAMDKVAVADSWNLPVVVTDCRYPNEADALKARGFTLVRVLRPLVVGSSGNTHASETALDDYPHDATVLNNGSLEDLRREVLSLVR